MASQITRTFAPLAVPVGAAFIFHGSVLADGVSSPNPAAVYAEPALGCCPREKKPDEECKDTELERLVMKCREGLGPYKNTVVGHTNKALNEINSYYGKVKDNLCYLRKRAPEEVRIGTVVVGGLTGLLLGIRGGVFRKLILGSLGTSGAAYLAYPSETEKFTRKYSSIAYNFVTGTSK